jgi:hypothetical protein
MIKMLEILGSVIAVLLVVGSPLLYRYLKGRVDEKTLALVFGVADKVVKAVEQEIKGVKMGPTRYDQAVEDIKDILDARGIKADDFLIDKAIHAAVWLINKDKMVAEDPKE